MRFIYLPGSDEEWLLLFGIFAFIIVIALAIGLKDQLWPSPSKKLLADERYQQALGVYVTRLQIEDPTRDQMNEARDAAVEYLVSAHGIAEPEARRHFPFVAAPYDKERSMEVRHDAIAYERAGAYDLALEHYQRAARWQQTNDLEDHEFLQRCIARVRKRVRPG